MIRVEINVKQVKSTSEQPSRHGNGFRQRFHPLFLSPLSLLCTFLLAMTVADPLAELLAVVVLALRVLVFWCFGTRTYAHWHHWQHWQARAHNLFDPCQLLLQPVLCFCPSLLAALLCLAALL